MAENQRGEGEEGKAPQAVKIDVQHTDGVRKSRGQLIANLLLHPVKKKKTTQSGEGEEGKASDTVKIDVQDTDGVRKVISHTISLRPSIWRILDNLLVKRTADRKFSASSREKKKPPQSGEGEEGKASDTVKIGVQDTDGVRKVISHTISLRLPYGGS
ncbi:unnamed protein product [Mytilus coruscus]|uniref:Uncharacterized protein n=1 Tax=Mytilus coruscus TaxID=42192 RepID=A0A6J8BPD1_MYTCO|nr:unnamed protein product [Mytilus coruscus]